MRTIVVPEPIQLVDAVTGKAGDIADFRTYAYKIWLNDPRWNDSISRRARLVLVCKEFDKRPGETIILEDSDYDVLKEIIEKPLRDQNGNVFAYQPLAQIQVDEFVRLVLNATKADASTALAGGKKKIQ